MEWKVEINDFLYDSNKNIIRLDNPPEFLTGSPVGGEVVHLSFPIPLNDQILINCCRFTAISSIEFEKNGIKVTTGTDGRYHINGQTILWLNDLQQIWRQLTGRELVIDITNLQRYI